MGHCSHEKLMIKLMKNYIKFNIHNNSFNSDVKYYKDYTTTLDKEGWQSKNLAKILENIIKAKEEDHTNFQNLKKEISTYPSLFNNMHYNIKTKAHKKGHFQKSKGEYYIMPNDTDIIDI